MNKQSMSRKKIVEFFTGVSKHVVKHRKNWTTDTLGYEFWLKQPVGVFKQVYDRYYGDDCYANLILPEGTHVVLAKKSDYSCGHKLRANQAWVESIYKTYSKKQVKEARSGHKSGFIYREQTFVFPVAFNANVVLDCAGGIHFCMDLEAFGDFR